MKDIIVVCPDCDSAKREFCRFMAYFGALIVQRSNKYRRMITLKSGMHITFMASKKSIVISKDFFVCSLQEFKQILLAIAEEKEKANGEENTTKSNQG